MWGFKLYTDEFYILEIQKENMKVINHFHTYCRDYFRKTYKKLFQEENLEDDFFQESFVKLWKEIRRCSIFVQNNQIYKRNAAGEINLLKCSLRTYLIDITKNDYNQYLRKKEVSARDMEQLLSSKMSEADVTTHTEDLKSKIVSECVMNLPDSCYKIISLFYYEQKNYDEIMEMSDNYTSKDALKTRKYKCMEQLQKRIEEKLNMYNLKPYLHERGNFK